MYANACCPKVILTKGRLTKVLSVCCGGGWGDRTRMTDKEEQVNYDIHKSAQQDEVFYRNEVTKDQFRSFQRAEEEERSGQWRDDKYN